MLTCVKLALLTLHFPVQALEWSPIRKQRLSVCVHTYIHTDIYTFQFFLLQQTCLLHLCTAALCSSADQSCPQMQEGSLLKRKGVEMLIFFIKLTASVLFMYSYICRDVHIHRAWITFCHSVCTRRGMVCACSRRCHWYKRLISYRIFSFAAMSKLS